MVQYYILFAVGWTNAVQYLKWESMRYVCKLPLNCMFIQKVFTLAYSGNSYQQLGVCVWTDRSVQISIDGGIKKVDEYELAFRRDMSPNDKPNINNRLSKLQG